MAALTLGTNEGSTRINKVFVLAINELRDADDLAYRLAADPSSATQTDFEAYDRRHRWPPARDFAPRRSDFGLWRCGRSLYPATTHRC